MKNFEYHVEKVYNFTNPTIFQDTLNDLAEKSWELDWVLEPIKAEFVILVFKRQVGVYIER